MDASDPDAVAVYKIVARDKSGAWTLKPIAMTEIEAATVNLSGAVRYPYLRSGGHARHAWRRGADRRKQHAVFPVAYPIDEPRRMWTVMRRGQPFNAGRLVKMRTPAASACRGAGI